MHGGFLALRKMNNISGWLYSKLMAEFQCEEEMYRRWKIGQDIEKHFQ